MKPLGPIFAGGFGIARDVLNARSNTDGNRGAQQPDVVGKGLPTYHGDRCWAGSWVVARDMLGVHANTDRHRPGNRPDIVGNGLPTYQSMRAAGNERSPAFVGRQALADAVGMAS